MVTLCWGLQSVVDPGFKKGGGGGINNGCLFSLRPHIYNIIIKTTRCEVVKNSASPKRPFFGFRVISPVFRAFLVQAKQKNFWMPKRGTAYA